MNRGFISALSLSVAAALLAGCGGSQLPVSTLGAMPQSAQPNATAHRASGSSDVLLYVETTNKTYILNYPSLKTFAVSKYGQIPIMTADPNNGNIIIGDYEFTHGATKPFASVPLKMGEGLVDAAFDPTTDSIACAVRELGQDSGWIAIYKDWSSNPTIYTDSTFKWYSKVGYDGTGNLFTLGLDAANNIVFGELPKGQNKFIDISFASAGIKNPTNILWDGAYLVIRSGASLYRVTLSGSDISVVSKTTLKGAFSPPYVKFGIYGDSTLAPHLGGAPHNGRGFALWNYPSGGKAYQKIKYLSKNKKERVVALGFSLAPTR
jgi:hypothetical protein